MWDKWPSVKYLFFADSLRVIYSIPSGIRMASVHQEHGLQFAGIALDPAEHVAGVAVQASDRLEPAHEGFRGCALARDGSSKNAAAEPMAALNGSRGNAYESDARTLRCGSKSGRRRSA